jgi:hypothetical protein
VPALKRVDVIVGTVTGKVPDRDSFTAPDTDPWVDLWFYTDPMWVLRQ